VRLCDVGAAIQEVMESYEVEINGKVYQGMMLLFIVFILFGLHSARFSIYNAQIQNLHFFVIK
jgi:hypothetical protein